MLYCLRPHTFSLHCNLRTYHYLPQGAYIHPLYIRATSKEAGDTGSKRIERMLIDIIAVRGGMLYISYKGRYDLVGDTSILATVPTRMDDVLSRT